MIVIGYTSVELIVFSLNYYARLYYYMVKLQKYVHILYSLYGHVKRHILFVCLVSYFMGLVICGNYGMIIDGIEALCRVQFCSIRMAVLKLHSTLNSRL